VSWTSLTSRPFWTVSKFVDWGSVFSLPSLPLSISSMLRIGCEVANNIIYSTIFANTASWRSRGHASRTKSRVSVASVFPIACQMLSLENPDFILRLRQNVDLICLL
jgi:hypothetical protein